MLWDLLGLGESGSFQGPISVANWNVCEKYTKLDIMKCHSQYVLDRCQLLAWNPIPMVSY